MPSTDFVADFLTRLRNASRAGKEEVSLPSSKLTERIVEILKEEGFIANYKPFNEGNKRFIRVHLKYLRGRRPALQGIQRVSKAGCRIYLGCDEIPKILGGLGVSVVSTSKGVVVDREARKARVGGEFVCKVW